LTHRFGAKAHISAGGVLAQQERHQYLDVLDPVPQRRHCHGLGDRRGAAVDVVSASSTLSCNPMGG
jgi:hypothetical protein